jgi:prolyl-tRNA synthetase
MKVSKLLTKTLKEIPTEADTISHQLLLRAGMIYPVASGIYSFLPLGWRVLKKIEAIVREEMDKAGGQELMLPALQPVEIWQQSDRFKSFGKTLFTLKDRRERELLLGPTHEEVITLIVRRYVRSYRDLPLLLYQIQTKFRDEPRPRGGLLRVREFVMKDLYSFDADEAGLDRSYELMVQAYKNIYDRLGLPALLVEADSGAIGGKESHEFMVPTPLGEDTIIHCPHCGYAANVDKAQGIKGVAREEPLLPLEEIATPGIKTISELAQFLGIPTSRTLKAVFYWADGEIALVAIRGDLEVNEVKLRNCLKCSELRLATDEEVERAGLISGSASPIGLKGVKTVGDDSIALGQNWVAGANKPDTHIRNVNYPRDFQVDILTDIAMAKEGQGCPHCGHELTSLKGTEVGHVFKLGIFLSQKLGARFLDPDGVPHLIIMGCYGIGLGRLLAAVVEHSHDEKGIIWPISIAPYQVYLCPLYIDHPEIKETSERLYDQLQREGIEVLYDDRDESPGVKFNDADLIGLPLRLTISPRTLQQQAVEIKRRTEKEGKLLPLSQVTEGIKPLFKP